MDINYLRAISREFHDEMVQRQKTFKNLIASNTMTRDEANHRFLCLRDAKRIIDAHVANEPETVTARTLDEIGAELLIEIAFRKKVYGYKVFRGFMTKFEMERKVAYFQFAHTLIAPPKPVEEVTNIQTSLF